MVIYIFLTLFQALHLCALDSGDMVCEIFNRAPDKKEQQG